MICEIEPLIPRMVSQFFSKENNDVLDDPRVEVVYDDARHYLLTSGRDVRRGHVRPDPPVGQGAAALYTKEYFEQVRRTSTLGGW